MADPLIIELANQFRAQLDTQANEATAAMAKQWLTVEDSLQGEITALAQALADKKAAGQPVTPSSLIKLNRYTSLLAQTQQQIEKFTGKAATQIGGLQQQAAKTGLSNAASLINAGAGNIGLTFDRLGAEAVQNIVAIARAGKPLSSLLNAAYPISANAITDYLIYGTAVGWNPRKTAGKIVKEGLAQGLQHVLLVARDQQVRSYREASRQQYQRSGLVSGYRRIAARNKRTCLACLALDGTVYPTNEVMHLHPQDRCSTIPIVEGFSPPTWQTGSEWFEKQSPETQREMLGPGKYEAWKNGDFEFSQLATAKDNKTWGPGAQVTSLKDLQAGKGGITVKPPKPKEIYTKEYHEFKAEVERIKAEGEFFEGELQEAEDGLFVEEQASKWAVKLGLKPDKMDASDWRKMADELKDQALEDLRLAREEDRIAAGNRAAGRTYIGHRREKQYIQVGGQVIEKQWTGGSEAAARKAVQKINDRTQKKAAEWMTGKLEDFGYKAETVDGLSYEQKRRLLAEIGNGELQASAIGKVSKAERERIVSGAGDRARRDARSIALNPRAGEGLDKWLGYEQAMIKAGREDFIDTLPDFREDKLPDYVMFAGGKKKVTPPPIKPKTLPEVLAPLEEKIRTQDYESSFALDKDGNIILSKDGGKSEVSFTNEEVKAIKGAAVMTHNHPGDSSFSLEDITFMASNGIVEMRAVGRNHTNVMRKAGALPPFTAEIREAFTKYNSEVHAEFTEKIRAGKMTVEEANLNHNHQIWLRAAPDLRLIYQRTAINEIDEIDF